MDLNKEEIISPSNLSTEMKVNDNPNTKSNTKELINPLHLLPEVKIDDNSDKELIKDQSVSPIHLVPDAKVDDIPDMDLNIEELINSINLSIDVKIDDIPDMDFYMEQLTNFIDKNLESLKRNEADKLLTKTMINSYTKEGLLMPTKNGKKYTRYHIISLILIYHLKQILSISDIQALFKPILESITMPTGDVTILKDIYTVFLEIKNIDSTNYSETCENKINLIKDEISKIDASDKDKDLAEKFLTIITLIAQAEANKRLAEKLIDTYFGSKDKE